MESLLNKTVFASLWVQILTGVVDTLALRLNVPSGKEILRDLLKMELFVQVIEGLFYIWLAMSISTVQNITPKRYYDWFITTPTMLITFVVYLIYLKGGEKEEGGLLDKMRENKRQLTAILILNAMMLGLGYLSEIGVLETKTAVFAGFIPFITYFYIIWENYANTAPIKGKVLFWSFFSIWSMYGVAALLPYVYKNASYNILDLFAKNFFGLFLAYLVYQQRV